MDRIKLFLETPLGKGIVESFRWAVFAGISILVDKLLVLFTGYPEQTPLVLILTFLLRYADSVLHKSGVAEKGLVRF